MEKYVKPEMEVIDIKNEVITASGAGTCIGEISGDIPATSNGGFPGLPGMSC